MVEWLRLKLAHEAIPGWAAGLYERAARLAIESYYAPLAQEIVAELGSGRILDVGTGPGYLPIEIVKRARWINVVGIDATPKMVYFASQRAKAQGMADRLTFIAGNAYALMFGDNSFDMVISTGVLHAWKDPARALAECCRVLKPGGVAWILDPAQILTGRNRRVWRRSLRWWEKLAYKVYSWLPRLVPPHRFSVGEIKDLLAKTPFVDGTAEQRDGIAIKVTKRRGEGRLER
ncbi:MAG: class I SAM-dependent methyltransferase [Deltaproteobacteria bacterium]|nr:class I SAM-dependent methyltransferase [Deltaproteobacteria bacterium]